MTSPAAEAAPDVFGDAARCLVLEPVVSAPGDDRPLFQRIAAPTHARVRYPRMPIEDVAARYPTAIGIQQAGTQPNPLGGEEPLYAFRGSQGDVVPLHEVAVRMPGADGLNDPLVLRPRVGEGDEVPSEFLTLWALLFCLSELARYYPDTWVAALDLIGRARRLSSNTGSSSRLNELRRSSTKR